MDIMEISSKPVLYCSMQVKLPLFARSQEQYNSSLTKKYICTSTALSGNLLQIFLSASCLETMAAPSPVCAFWTSG
jgi:hypothetical protein